MDQPWYGDVLNIVACSFLCMWLSSVVLETEMLCWGADEQVTS